MSQSSRHTAALVGGALFAAAIAATSVATISSVSADIGDIGLMAGIRVKPDNATPGSGTYGEDQNAAVIVADVSAQPASDVQLLIPSDWEAGDRITLQVQADGSLPPSLIPVHQTNCQTIVQTISFAGTATVAVTGGPWLFNQGWSVGDGGGVLPDQNGPGVADTKIPGTQTVTPEFIVNMKNDGTSCAGQPSVTNQIEIIFSNSASPTLTPGVPVVANTDQYELTISNIAYNVGANVNAGPVHVVPYARFADELAANLLVPVPFYFGGNNFDTPLASTMFTDNAFISPVAITATGGSLVADGTLQPLGSVTITELAGDALDNGVHTLFVPNVNLFGVPAVTVAVTGNGAATGTAAITNGFNAGPLGTGAQIDLTLAGMAATKGVVTISGLAATTGTAGDVSFFVLGPPAPTKPLAYFTPDDQLYDGVGANGAYLFSDVNIPTLVSVPVESSVGLLRVVTVPALPSRISVDGVVRADWGIDWLSVPVGVHTVCFSDVVGFSTPECVVTNVVGGATSVVSGEFVQLGLLKVNVVPAGLPSTVFVDGAWSDEYGLFSFVAPGAHVVCWGDVAGFQAPACEDVTVTGGAQTTVDGVFVVSESPTVGPAPDLGVVGFLRVETSPAVASRVVVDGVARADWGLTWVKVPVGAHEVCFTDVLGFTTPPCEQVVVSEAATSSVVGAFVPMGLLKVDVDPAGLGVDVVVDGVPRNQFGLYFFVAPGSHEVCGTSSVGWVSPACATVSVTGGAQTNTTLTYQMA